MKKYKWIERTWFYDNIDKRCAIKDSQCISHYWNWTLLEKRVKVL